MTKYLVLLTALSLSCPAHADDARSIKRQCNKEVTKAYFAQHHENSALLIFGALGGLLKAATATNETIKASDLNRLVRECEEKRLSASLSQPVSPASPLPQPSPQQSLSE